MITILHGDDIVASRNMLITLKKQFPDHTAFDGQSISLTDVYQAVEGENLFADEKTLFIEQLFSRRKSAEQKAIFSYLQKAGNISLYLWENKELTKATLIPWKEAKVQIFKLPQALFTFLDSLKPKNGSHMVTLFHQALQTNERDMLFYLLVARIRLLIALKQQSAIDEIKRMQPWQKTNLEKQARFFSEKQLIHSYIQLFALEQAQKTGNLSLDFAAAIDIFLLEV